MRIAKSAQIVAAVTLATAGLVSVTGPAWADGVYGDFQSGKSLGPQTSGYVPVKCPSTLPYIVGVAGETTISSEADAQHTSLTKFEIDDANRSVKVYFSNTQSFADAAHHPIDVSLTVTLTCSSEKPAQPPVPMVKQRVDVNPLGTMGTFILCPPSHPKLRNAIETHEPELVNVGLSDAPGSPGASASWRNDDALYYRRGVLHAYCTT
ncbi:hypothetical protein ABT120_10760 [Nonomuraea angiospora]|uniref:hypothetical protein n=1 Tax=Nonomuraea angiospora TaxID=46172 RepID=UPI0033288134